MAHPDYVTAARQMIDVRAAVGEYRANATALRRLWRSCPARNAAAATERAIERRTQRQRAIELSLCLAGHAVLVGELVREAKLVKRINDPIPTWGRSELKARLALTRQRIKLLLPL